MFKDQSMYERKVNTTSDLKLSGSNDGPGTMEFYLSTFANWDRVRPIPERPSPDAFTKHLDAFMRDGFIAYSHGWGSLPIGTPKDATLDAHGLLVKAEFHSTQEAQNARLVTKERLDRGLTVKTSMGYDVLDDELVPIQDNELEANGIKQGRLLKELYLYEGSIVNVPANPQADALSVKDWQPDCLPLSTHHEVALAAIKSYQERMSGFVDLRTKEGRTISAANRRKLESILEALSGLDSVKEAIDALLAIGMDSDEIEKSIAMDIRAERARFYANQKAYRDIQRSYGI